MDRPGIARVIVFAKDMERMTAFYGDVIGLPRVDTRDDSADFVSFRAGAIELALHRAEELVGARPESADDPPVARERAALKVAFHAADVHVRRAELESRGATLGPVHEFGALQLCDGLDPEGNVFQLSNR